MNKIKISVDGKIIERKPMVEKTVYGAIELYATYKGNRYLVRNGQNFLDGMIYETYSLIGLF